MPKMSDYYIKVGNIYPYEIRHASGDMMPIHQSVLVVNDSDRQLSGATIYSNCDDNGKLSQKAPTGTLQYTTETIDGQIVKGSPCYLHISSSERTVSDNPILNPDGSLTYEKLIERNISLSGALFIQRIKQGDNDWENYNSSVWSSYELDTSISRIDVILEIIGGGGPITLYAYGQVIIDTTYPN